MGYLTFQGGEGMGSCWDAYDRLSAYQATSAWVSHNAPEEVKELAHLRVSTMKGNVYYI